MKIFNINLYSYYDNVTKKKKKNTHHPMDHCTLFTKSRRQSVLPYFPRCIIVFFFSVDFYGEHAVIKYDTMKIAVKLPRESEYNA